MEKDNKRKRKVPEWLSSYTTSGLAELCADDDPNELDDVDVDSESSVWSDSDTDDRSSSSEEDEPAQSAVVSDEVDLDVPLPSPEAETEAVDGAGDRPRPRPRGRRAPPPPVDTTTWNRIPAGTRSFTKSRDPDAEHFPLKMKAEIGVDPDLFGPNPTELQCFEALFDPDIIDQLLKDINEYGARKRMQNTPPRKRSCFDKWTDVTEKELLKFLAVVMVMGLDKRPCIKDYWAGAKDFPAFHTPWFKHMFDRERFEVSNINKYVLVIYDNNVCHISLLVILFSSIILTL